MPRPTSQANNSRLQSWYGEGSLVLDDQGPLVHICFAPVSSIPLHWALLARMTCMHKLLSHLLGTGLCYSAI